MWVSRWRSVIARRGGRVRGLPSSPNPSSTAASAELRHDLGCGRIEVEPSLLDELHRRGAGDRLGHRRDPAHGVRRHLVAGPEHALPESAEIELRVRIRHPGHDAPEPRRRRRPRSEHHRSSLSWTWQCSRSVTPVAIVDPKAGRCGPDSGVAGRGAGRAAAPRPVISQVGIQRTLDERIRARRLRENGPIAGCAAGRCTSRRGARGAD